MEMETDLNYYPRGLELAQQGRYQEALGCIEEHLRRAPEDAQALNDAGAVLHCLGRSAEAIHHLTRAKNLQGDCAEIVWNLMEAYLADGRANEAMQLFGDMERMHILNADVLNRTTKILLDQDDKANAIEVLLRSLQLWPEQEILSPMIEIIRSKRPKVAFFCGPTEYAKALADIHQFTKARFPVELFEGHNHDQMCQLMQWSDIAWFERCADMAVEASKLPKVCKIIVRLHDHEACDNWPTQVQWSNVDALIMGGNPFVKDSLLKQLPDIRKRTWIVTIPKGASLDKFKFASRDRGKNLAFVGHLSARKNPMFLLQCMQKLHYLDPGYKLFFAGTFQNPMLQQYMKHMVHELDLTSAVFFDGWQEDMNAWLQDKHYIISCSIGPSQSAGLLEGMACGLKPVIHNFPGANEIFPPEFLFNISEEFCERILSGQYEPQRYRKFVEADYALIDQLRKINSVFTQLEAEINLQKMEPIAGGSPDQGPTDIRLSPEMDAWTIENNGYTNPETV